MEGIYFSGVNPGKVTEGEVAERRQLECTNLEGAGSEARREKGRPSSLDGRRLKELLDIYYTRPYSLRQIAGIMGVSRMTVWRAVQSTQAVIPMR